MELTKNFVGGQLDDNDLIMRGSLPFRDDIKIPSIYGLGDGNPGILNPPTHGFLL